LSTVSLSTFFGTVEILVVATTSGNMQKLEGHHDGDPAVAISLDGNNVAGSKLATNIGQPNLGLASLHTQRLSPSFRPRY